MGFENGKIYKLECSDGHYYYGSTINDLRIRLRDHKLASKKQPYRVYEHINKVGWENVKIVLVEAYSCQNRRELNRKETEYISSHKSDPLCLNTILSFITEEAKKEYKRNHTQKNKEVLAKYHKQKRTGNPDVAEYQRKYRETHQEELKEKKKQYYLEHKEEDNKRCLNRYYKNREAILLKKRQKYHENKSNP